MLPRGDITLHGVPGQYIAVLFKHEKEKNICMCVHAPHTWVTYKLYIMTLGQRSRSPRRSRLPEPHT